MSLEETRPELCDIALLFYNGQLRQEPSESFFWADRIGLICGYIHLAGSVFRCIFLLGRIDPLIGHIFFSDTGEIQIRRHGSSFDAK